MAESPTRVRRLPMLVRGVLLVGVLVGAGALIDRLGGRPHTVSLPFLVIALVVLGGWAAAEKRQRSR